MNSDGTKLSKRQSDIHVEHYKKEGYYPEAIINFLTMTGGAFKTIGNVRKNRFCLAKIKLFFGNDVKYVKCNSIPKDLLH